MTEARADRGRRRRMAWLVGGGLVVLLMAFVLWYELESHALGPAGPQVVITIHDGETVNAVVEDLSRVHAIGSSLAFRISDLVHGDPTVLPGSYALHENQSFAEVRAILAGGPNVFVVTVNPGLTLHEVAAQVDSVPGHAGSSFAKVAASGAVRSLFSPPGSDNLEGMLGTGNYLVFPGMSDTSILGRMVQRFDRAAAAAGLNSSSGQAFGLSPYEVIIAASVVEKEGYIVKNMPDVARVIYNRLAADMALQMDSTVLYALGRDGGAVTSQDLQFASPYNSYLNNGLPPTPICSPSPQALAAAVHPPPGSWLYFVLVEKNGTEAFSDTFAQQLANEKLAQSRGVG
ncbi:MAG TPA: endolytic transglycosylase MltG [Acidimicrobiales bacterium]|nr:endolytic transglycosylase MltG [Acidimicrobiales bacterium]